MNIAQSVKNTIEVMPPGQVFGYQAIPDYIKAPAAVVKAVGRLIKADKVKRLSKGQFYVPKQGILGPRKPSDDALLHSLLYKAGRVRGYITGPLLYNQLGLTTQLPHTAIVAWNGARMEKDFGTIRVKTIASRVPVEEQNIKLLQYLDVLCDLKKIPDTDSTQALLLMRERIADLTRSDRQLMIDLAAQYYGAQVRALLCLLLSDLGQNVPDSLKTSLNPTTTYQLSLDPAIWPDAKRWNIR